MTAIGLGQVASCCVADLQLQGAYVCAQRYQKTKQHPNRVSIAVADCGQGISAHLKHQYPAAANHRNALQLAMQPGVTGTMQSGMYGSSDNAGAGLFITRAIAKATGGYFSLISGSAAFRLKRRGTKPLKLYVDPFIEEEAEVFDWPGWNGTVAAVEVVTDTIAKFPNFFQWVRNQIPAAKTVADKIKFT